MAVTSVVLFCIQNKQTCFCDFALKMFELVHTYMGIFKNIYIYIFQSRTCQITRNGSTKNNNGAGSRMWTDAEVVLLLNIALEYILKT